MSATAPAPDPDELVMRLVEEALARPESERESYLRNACRNDTALFEQAWHYVTWEQRMGGFLQEPILQRPASEASGSGTANERPFQPGQLLINRFRIVGEIAEGGMGIVWEAQDEKLERTVAIKCAKAGFGKQLPPEVKNASEISHPNVCKIHEIHTVSTPQGEIDFISMEFLQGETLTERLKRGPILKEQARTIARQLCAGLGEAHKNRVIHGDLKSNNVILATGPDGAIRAVITDFGLARRPDASGRSWMSGGPAGTPDYMAPELWKGARPSVASDIYALGVIFREMFSNRAAHPHGSQTSWSGASTLPLGQEPSPVSNKKTGNWYRIVARCVEQDPARRFASAAEVSRALGPSLTWRWIWAIAATLLLAVGSGLAAYYSAVPPREQVRLAVVPFRAMGDNSATLAQQLLRDATNTISHLEGNPRTKFSVVSNDRKPDHVVSGTLTTDHGKVTLHAVLTDERSGTSTKEWHAEYPPEEMRFAPVALAGFLAVGFKLPPLVAKGQVNAAAQHDYQGGLADLRSDITIDAALASMERAVSADPDSALTHAGLAEAQWQQYFNSEDKTWLNRAADSVHQAQRRNPDLAEVHRIAGQLAKTAGEYEQALAEYQRAIEIDPNNGDGYRRLGGLYEFSNHLSEALAALRKAIEVEPGYFREYQELGAFYFQKSDYVSAIEAFRTAVELAPGEPSARFALALGYLYTGQYAKAEGELRTSLRLKETAASLQTIGLVLMYQERERDALSFLLRASTLKPDWYLPLMDLGICYRRTRQFSKAEKANLRGLRAAQIEVAKDPNVGESHAFLAYLCASTADYSRAESEVAQAMHFSPTDGETQWMAVLTWETMHQRERSLAILRSASRDLLSDLNRWPDMADLRKDPRFKDLLTAHGIEPERKTHDDQVQD